MENLVKRATSLIKSRYLIFLLLVVLISYGQLLWMYVWQDDNGLFFKLAHISENAGYLSAGPFGTGAYKYIVTPYIPIYYFFGYNTVAYFAWMIGLYYLATVVVYKVFSKILGQSAGRVTGFLFASGYISSDGVIRIFNSASTSVGLILISTLLLGYWNFYKQKKIIWYLVALISFWLALELTPARTHYLISVVLAFEVIFLTFSKPLKSIFWSLLRLVPLGYIFYRYFIVNADYRSGQVGYFLTALLKGEWYQTYSLVTSFANTVWADWFMNRWQVFPASIVLWLIMFLGIIIVGLILRNHSKNKLLIPIFALVMIAWKVLVDNLFISPVLNIGQPQLLIIFFGGMAALLLMATILVIAEHRKLLIFLCLWMVLNIAAYAAYNPLITYESINRYLGHSFLAWVGVLGIFYLSIQSTTYKSLVTLLIIGWGVGNLISSVIYQHNIIKVRSNPPRAFYQQLKEYVPQAKKGDIFYFDVADNARTQFEDAFSVASMPETTAIAWRYGIDRYDIKRFTLFSELAVSLTATASARQVYPDQIHSFWYTKNGLVDTSAEMRDKIFKPNSKTEEVQFIMQPDGSVQFSEALSSVYPFELILNIDAKALDSSKASFPFNGSNSLPVSSLNSSPELISLLIDYKNSKQQLINTSKYISSSQWRERILSYINDQNPDTSWQADRVLWQKRNESVTIDLGSAQSVSKLVWINGFGNNTPTAYTIDLSEDGQNWRKVKTIKDSKRVDTKEPQVVDFGPETTRFVRMSITATITGDSPIIAELWVVAGKFDQLNIVEAEKYLSNPFALVPDAQTFSRLLQAFDYTGQSQVFWISDKYLDWRTEYDRNVAIRFDGGEQQIKVLIPAGGTAVSKIKLSNSTMPGTINIKSIQVRYPNLSEIDFQP